MNATNFIAYDKNDDLMGVLSNFEDIEPDERLRLITKMVNVHCDNRDHPEQTFSDMDIDNPMEWGQTQTITATRPDTQEGFTFTLQRVEVY